jgi:AcrR family transcriptional regulator
MAQSVIMREKSPRKSVAASPAKRKSSSQESLRKINKAARSLFLERGYDGARPQDIARKAGLGHGTFYLHYDDKLSCFLFFAEEARRELEAYVCARQIPDKSLTDRLADTAEAILDYSRESPGMFRVAMADIRVIAPKISTYSNLFARWGEEWTERIRNSIRSGDMSASCEAAVVGPAIASGGSNSRLLLGTRTCNIKRPGSTYDAADRQVIS